MKQYKRTRFNPVVPETVTEEPVTQAEEPVTEIGEAEVVEPELFVLMVGEKWFKSWNPYRLTNKKSEAKVLDADWARQYKSDIKMMKRIVAEVVKA